MGANQATSASSNSKATAYDLDLKNWLAWTIWASVGALTMYSALAALSALVPTSLVWMVARYPSSSATYSTRRSRPSAPKMV